MVGNWFEGDRDIVWWILVISCFQINGNGLFFTWCWLFCVIVIHGYGRYSNLYSNAKWIASWKLFAFSISSSLLRVFFTAISLLHTFSAVSLIERP